MILEMKEQLSLFEKKDRPEKCESCERLEVCNLVPGQCEGWDCKEGVINKYYPEQKVLNGGVAFKEGSEGGIEFSKAVVSCGSKFINARCVDDIEHSYFIELNCGKEYCPKCGVKGSRVHKKRVNKAMKRLNHIEKFSTLTITVPKEHAEIFLDRDKLNSFYKSGIRVAKLIGLGGFARVHFFGDKRESYLELHPHLNILIVEGGYIKKEELEFIKVSIGRSFRAIIGCDVEVNLHYQYYVKKGDIWRDSKGNSCKGNILVHKVKYITRATVGYERFKSLEYGLKEGLFLLLEGDKESHKRIILMRWWGDMSNAKYKKIVAEIVGVGAFDAEGDEMLCPCCNSKMRFVLVDSYLVPDKKEMKEVLPGVYQVKKREKIVDTGFKTEIKKEVENGMEAFFVEGVNNV